LDILNYLEKGKDKGKPFERRGRFTDTWINLNGQWRSLPVTSA